MLTSILIRSKNEAKDLPKTLEIIREQSVTSREIIIVDSGSTDGTVELVQQQRDIKLIQIAPKAMLQLGYRIIYEPEAVVYHSHNESLIKVYKRTYREALAQKELYPYKMPLRQAFQMWQKLVSDDIEFILQNDNNRQWLLKVPVYRLFFTLGHLRPHLPNVLWEAFSNRWQRIIDKFSKEQIKE